MTHHIETDTQKLNSIQANIRSSADHLPEDDQDLRSVILQASDAVLDRLDQRNREARGQEVIYTDAPTPEEIYRGDKDD